MASRVALFDLDHTLLSGDSDDLWFEFLTDEGLVDRAVEGARKAEVMRRYREGSVGAHEFCEFFLSFYVPHEMPTLLAWRERYLRERIVPRIPASARTLLAKHASDLVVIATATNRFLTEPIAAELGARHLVATEPELREGRFTGRVAGTPSFRDGKATRVRAWLADRGEPLEAFDESWFYSDSINDRPLLERVTHPVAVDPDPSLRALATERGWPVLELERGAQAG